MLAIINPNFLGIFRRDGTGLWRHERAFGDWRWEWGISSGTPETEKGRLTDQQGHWRRTARRSLSQLLQGRTKILLVLLPRARHKDEAKYLHGRSDDGDPFQRGLEDDNQGGMHPRKVEKVPVRIHQLSWQHSMKFKPTRDKTNRNRPARQSQLHGQPSISLSPGTVPDDSIL